MQLVKDARSKCPSRNVHYNVMKKLQEGKAMLSMADGYGIGGGVQKMNTFRTRDHIKST